MTAVENGHLVTVVKPPCDRGSEGICFAHLCYYFSLASSGASRSQNSSPFPSVEWRNRWRFAPPRRSRRRRLAAGPGLSTRWPPARRWRWRWAPTRRYISSGSGRAGARWWGSSPPGSLPRGSRGNPWSRSLGSP